MALQTRTILRFKAHDSTRGRCDTRWSRAAFTTLLGAKAMDGQPPQKSMTKGPLFCINIVQSLNYTVCLQQCRRSTFCPRCITVGGGFPRRQMMQQEATEPMPKTQSKKEVACRISAAYAPAKGHVRGLKEGPSLTNKARGVYDVSHDATVSLPAWKASRALRTSRRVGRP